MTRASNKITETMIGAAIEAHCPLSTGPVQPTDEACLADEVAATPDTSSFQHVEGVFVSAFSAPSAVKDYNYSVADRPLRDKPLACGRKI
jgi:hypothetical protein